MCGAGFSDQKFTSCGTGEDGCSFKEAAAEEERSLDTDSWAGTT